MSDKSTSESDVMAERKSPQPPSSLIENESIDDKQQNTSSQLEGSSNIKQNLIVKMLEEICDKKRVFFVIEFLFVWFSFLI